MPEPGDHKVARQASRGRLRASRADREQVIDTLKAAFVEDRLTKDEFDARVGYALASRTYADLAALTADLPARPATARRPRRPEKQPGNTTVKSGARVIAATTVSWEAYGRPRCSARATARYGPRSYGPSASSGLES